MEQLCFVACKSVLGDSDTFAGDKFPLLACERAEGFFSHGKTPSGKSTKGTNKQAMMKMPIKKGVNCVECECLVAIFLAWRLGRLLMSVMVVLNCGKRVGLKTL
jgi:hypothetical protein